MLRKLKMLIIRTNHDIQTYYLYLWSEELINEAQKKFKIAQIEGRDITEKVVRSRIENRRPKCIFFNGHGTRDSLFNNEKKPFIDIKSSDVFMGTVTYARACDCLKELGKSAVENGCLAFVGYKRKFWIARNNKYSCRPLEDKVAKPVLECSNIVMKELIKGKNVEESIQKSHEKAADNILELIYSEEPLAIASLQALVANDSSLDFEGIGTSKIC